jgi:hypothetical protein
MIKHKSVLFGSDLRSNNFLLCEDGLTKYSGNWMSCKAAQLPPCSRVSTDFTWAREHRSSGRTDHIKLNNWGEFNITRCGNSLGKPKKDEFHTPERESEVVLNTLCLKWRGRKKSWSSERVAVQRGLLDWSSALQGTCRLTTEPHQGALRGKHNFTPTCLLICYQVHRVAWS